MDTYELFILVNFNTNLVKVLADILCRINDIIRTFLPSTLVVINGVVFDNFIYNLKYMSRLKL